MAWTKRIIGYKQFEWPGLKKAGEKRFYVCLSCQQARDAWTLRFLLRSIELSGFNEVVQIGKSENLHGGHGLQETAGNDSSFHKIITNTLYDS